MKYLAERNNGSYTFFCNEHSINRSIYCICLDYISDRYLEDSNEVIQCYRYLDLY